MFWKIEHFVRDFNKEHGPFEKVMDVGSRNINGSVKDGLTGYTEFIGVDMIEGKDVDIVIDAHDLDTLHYENYFDLVTCCETIEHDVNFWTTVRHIRSIVKPGGWMLFTAPSINFFRHDFPSDYYRFTTSAFTDFIFKDFEDVHVEEYFDANDPCTQKPNNTILGYGRKPL